MEFISFILSQLLAAYTVLVEPILRTNFYRMLKKQLNTNAAARLPYYRTQLLWEWSWVVVLALILIPMKLPFNWLGLALPNQIGWIVTAALLLGIGLSTYLLKRNPGAMEAMRRSLESSWILLPTTPEERRWFAATAITAGICEELLYRGFLTHYVTSMFPGLDWLMAAILTGIVYGLSRAYQGFKGISQTALTGFSFAIVYYLSGSLLPAILFHMLAELRTLVIWQPEPDSKKKK